MPVAFASCVITGGFVSPIYRRGNVRFGIFGGKVVYTRPFARAVCEGPRGTEGRRDIMRLFPRAPRANRPRVQTRTIAGGRLRRAAESTCRTYEKLPYGMRCAAPKHLSNDAFPYIRVAYTTLVHSSACTCLLSARCS